MTKSNQLQIWIDEGCLVETASEYVLFKTPNAITEKIILDKPLKITGKIDFTKVKGMYDVSDCIPPITMCGEDSTFLILPLKSQEKHSQPKVKDGK